MKKTIIAAAAMFMSLAAVAQQVLSLEDCRRMALENNVAIKNSALENRVAQAVRRQAFTKYFPEVSATGMAFTTNHSVINYDFDGNIPIPPIPEVAPQGGAIPFSLDFSLIKKGVMVGANLVQPVFMGGMIVNANRLAEVGEAVAELQSQQSADQVSLTVEQYYWQLATLKSKRATVNELMALLDTLEYQVQAAVDAGVVLRNDLLEVQLRKNEMASARTELDNGITIMSTLLGQYIGQGLDPVTIDAEISPALNVESPLSLFVAPEDALENTTDYALLRQQVRAADLGKRLAIGANLPKVAIGAGYFYQNLLDQGHGFGAIYAAVTVPISGWWGGSHSIRAARLRHEMAQNSLADYSELLQVRMSNNWNELNTAYEQIGIAQLSVEQAAENLRLNENYYRYGTITVTDLLKAQALYRKANDQFTDAYGEYKVKTIQYLQSTGR